MQLVYLGTLDEGHLRLARIEDVSRLAYIATASFWRTRMFHRERPYHTNHPHATRDSYQHYLATAIRSRKRIVIVALDKCDPCEDDHNGGAHVLKDGADEDPSPGQDVIVGFAIWNMSDLPARHGQFMGITDTYVAWYPHQGSEADKDMHAIRQLEDMIEKKGDKHFDGTLVLQAICVHPAYWRRGHAKALVEWGLGLADLDRVSTSVNSTADAEALYEKTGFHKLEDFTIENEDKTKSVYASFWLREPRTSSSASSPIYPLD